MAPELRLEGRVGQDHRLIVEVPPEIPVGPVEVTIRALANSGAPRWPSENPEREALRARLLAAGRLVTERFAPDDAIPLSDAELQRLGTLPPGARPSEDLIDEDRGAY